MNTPLRLFGNRFWKYILGSIRTKFILSFLLLSLIPLVLFATFSLRAYLDILQGNVNSYANEVIDRIDRNLQIYLSDLDRILEFRNDYYILQFIKLSLADDIEGNRKYTFRLLENLSNIKNLKTDLSDIAIITREGVKIDCSGVTHVDLSQEQLFQMLVNRTPKEKTSAFWGPHQDWLGRNVFSVGAAIYGDYGNFLGIMTIDVDMRLLDEICRNIKLGKTGYVMLIDGDGQIVYHPKNGLIGKSVSLLLGNPSNTEWQSGFFMPRVRNGNEVITVKTFKPANWRIIGVSNKAELAEKMNTVTGISLIFILVLLIPLVILVALFLAGLLTRPIMELQQSMSRAAEDLNTNVAVKTNDEIGQLGESFNQMLARIRELMDQCVLEQKKLRRTEMTALQEQIKPHFIYNTLDLIIGLLETNKNDDVINMVEALGMFFRLSLNQGQEYITIREEIEHVRNYLYLQRFRHGDKYDYVFEVDSRLLEHKTIKLILQPLVENAIYHGVRPLNSPGGLITVKGYLDQDQVCFEVLDNGVGMEEAKISEINQCFSDESPGEQQHYFGLRNVHERIVLAFGKGYGLHLEQNPGGGIRVIGRLPLI
ncbi:MAG: sensor histidine kinase [Firmicutes bacterium]|nr:sensor histidine kinase [Bacillota bacterium]